ncbi:AAA family ATPase [Pasteurella multocida]
MNLFSDKIQFEKMKGVGTMTLDLVPNQRVYTLIGENGIGKTKLLESLFAFLLFTNKQVLKTGRSVNATLVPFQKVFFDNATTELQGWFSLHQQNSYFSFQHNFPVVYLSAQHRGAINEKSYDRGKIVKLGSRDNRKNQYLYYLLKSFEGNPEGLKNINMDIDLEEWIIQRAQSANPYQAKEDNREIEIKTLLSLLHQVDERISPDFLEISGDNRVFIHIEEQKRELSELSSGFSSILKILQSIIAGYSYFTNETQIANVKGVVLIDEIESHLHNKWQVNIIPLLKKLFPNTTFVITTHSSLVISQLSDGEAYRLERNKEDGVVYAKPIKNPSKITFIDLMQNAFDVNLNQLKINRAMQSDQKQVKKMLLDFVNEQLETLGDK